MKTQFAAIISVWMDSSRQRFHVAVVYWALLALVSAGMLVPNTWALSNPVPSISEPLLPTSIVPGGADFTLTVNGTGFVSGSVVRWNRSPLATTFVNSEQLTANVPAANIAAAGTAWVTVHSPGAGGVVSNVVFLPITRPTSTASFRQLDCKGGGAAAVGDFNGDGKLDYVSLISGSGGDVTVAVQLGNGWGSFKTQRTTGLKGPRGMTTGDFNHDGKLDLAIIFYWDIYDQGVYILLGNGDGTFQSAVTFESAYNLSGTIISADFDGDGKLDLAMVAQDPHEDLNDLFVALGNGDGTFRWLYAAFAPHYANSLAAADFNGDGRLDLAVSGEDGVVSILLGNGDGSFKDSAFYSSVPGMWYPHIADFNRDGKLDIAGSVGMLLGNGDGTFQNLVPYPADTVYGSLAVGDFNGDGVPDLAADVDLLLGNGDGTFQNIMSFGTGFGGAVAGDFNRDGRLDLVTSSGATTVVLLQSAVMTISPATLDFGEQKVGTSSSAQTVTLTNSGSAPMLLANMSLTGSNPGAFALKRACRWHLEAGSSCTVGVRFKPSSLGGKSASLSITDNAPSSPHTVGLSGTGIE